MQGRFARTLFCRCRARAPLAIQIIGNRCGCPTIVLAIQSDSIRPFSPLFHETGTDRVFLNEKPFVVQGFAPPQEDDRKSLVAISRMRQVLDVSTVLMPPKNFQLLFRDLSAKRWREDGRA